MNAERPWSFLIVFGQLYFVVHEHCVVLHLARDRAARDKCSRDMIGNSIGSKMAAKRWRKGNNTAVG